MFFFCKNILFFSSFYLLFSCPEQLNRWPCPLVGLLPLTIRVFKTLQSEPRDLWPLRHLTSVMRRHVERNWHKNTARQCRLYLQKLTTWINWEASNLPNLWYFPINFTVSFRVSFAVSLTIMKLMIVEIAPNIQFCSRFKDNDIRHLIFLLFRCVSISRTYPGWWVCHRTRFSLCRLWTVTERPYSVDHMGQFLQGVLWSADTSWHWHHGNLKVLLTNWPGWGYKTKSWPIHSALANFTAFGYTFAIKIVSNPKKKVLKPLGLHLKKMARAQGKMR